MRVLYVNHTALVSGGEHSLLTLLAGLPAHVEPVVACPEGQLADMTRALGVPVRRIPGTAGSLRLHPLDSPRALLDLARSALAVRAAARQSNADLVHANSIRAGLIATAAGRIGGPPVVAHIRDHLPPGAVSDLSLRMIASGAGAVIANSAYTASRFGPHGGKLRVIGNAVDLDRFNPAAVDGRATRKQLGIDPSGVVLAVIGQLTPWKGQDLAIRVTADLAQSHPGVRLLLVGAAKFTSAHTRHDNRAYEAGLHELVADLGVEGRVHFLGEREDVPDLLGATDLLLAPSWEEPFGRSIAEAMAMGVPVVATEVGGPAEIIRPGVDGLLLPPAAVQRWAEAINALIHDAGRRAQMGTVGRERALGRFGAGEHVSAVLDAYAAVMSEVSAYSC